jgi:O-acetyl-ADP-ribose deacetylase (regulator of RNase III)
MDMAPVLIEPDPVEVRLANTVIRLIKDDLTTLPVDAFVFYAREDLSPGSGYGTAIQQRGGLVVKKELEAIGSIAMGEAVITGAGAMNAKHIIHACGPKFFEQDLEAKLRQCMRSALQVADENNLEVIAFPPMGYGFYGVPMDLCAKVMLEEMRGFLEGRQSSLKEILICAVDKRDFLALKDKVAAAA